VVWRKSLGTSVIAFSGADGSGNGVVDEADYYAWRTNFDNTLATFSPAAAHSAKTPEAPPSSGAVQDFAFAAAIAHAGPWQNAKADDIGPPTTIRVDLPGPLAMTYTSFDSARKASRQPPPPTTAFEAQDLALLTLIRLAGSSGGAHDSPLGWESDLAINTNCERPLKSKPTGSVSTKRIDNVLSIRDELFSKWNEWHRSPI
jgi:hypothetical protein